MVRAAVAEYRRRVRAELEAGFAETHTPRETARSFALGVFVTMLPTLGTGLLVFALVVAVVDRASKLALFAAVIVVTPVVKWGVYGTSFWPGSLLLGPISGVSIATVSLSSGPEVLLRLPLGTVLLALLATVVAYVGALRFVMALRRREIELEELLPGVPPE